MGGRGGDHQDWGPVESGAGGLRLVRSVKQRFRVRVHGQGRVRDQSCEGDDHGVLVHVRDLGCDQRGGGVVRRLCSWQYRGLVIIRLPTRCVYLK